MNRPKQPLQIAGQVAGWIAAGLILLVSSPQPAEADWPVGGLVVAGGTENQVWPMVAADGHGGAFIAWVSGPGGAEELRLQHLLASGDADPLWPSTGVAVCNVAGYVKSPRMIADGAGGVLLAWGDSRPIFNLDIYAQRILASGAVAPGWPVNGRAVCTAASDQQVPALVSDGAQGAVVAWEDLRSLAASGLDVYATRILGSGQLDPAWPVNGRLVCNAPNYQSRLVLATDGAGGAFISWNDLRGSPSVEGYVTHVLSTGALDPAWAANGNPLTTAVNDQSDADIVDDGAGGFYAAWRDKRADTGDIYVKRFTASGGTWVEWPSDGWPLCTGNSQQGIPRVARDGTSGVFVTWTDFRVAGTGGVGPDVYVHRMCACGLPGIGYPANGLLLSPLGNNQSGPVIVPDGVGGAFVGWRIFQYAEVGLNDVFAQHVLASAQVDPSWPSDGAVVCAASGEQANLQMVNSDPGAAILVWEDKRSGGWDIVAQRLPLPGTVDVPGDTPGDPVAGDLELAVPRPNPAQVQAALEFHLHAAADVTLELFDPRGRRIRTLVSGRSEPGMHRADWDLRDAHGARVSPGIYMIRLVAGGEMAQRKLVVLP